MTSGADHQNDTVTGDHAADGHPSDLGALSRLFVLWAQRGFHQRMIYLATGDSDYRVMNTVFALGVAGPMNPARLADTLGMTRSNASKVINRAETRGLVFRSPAVGDARGTVVNLSPEGHRAAQQQVNVVRRMMDTLTVDWSPERLARFTADASDLVEQAIPFIDTLYGGGDPFISPH